MADLVIRGMEMPKGNNAISIIIFSNGKVSLAHDKKYAEYAEAVPLPERHGRLGDLDELETTVIDAIEKGFNAVDILLDIRFAPTIIEAEGGEEA